MGSFGAFFVDSPNKLLNKHSSFQRFETYMHQQFKAITGSNNSLSPLQYQAISYTDVVLLSLIAGLNNSIGPIAWNCPKWPSGNHICGPTLPAKLAIWKFGQQTVSCVKQLIIAHAMRSWFWEVICKVTVMFNHFLFMISMISSPLYSLWLHDQLSIAPWFELSMT